MKRTLIASLILFAVQWVSAQVLERTAFTIGETITIHSEVFNGPRTVNIYLPNGYADDTSTTYPVIYLLDGAKDEDFIHIAGLVQFCSFPWVEIMSPSIVVGVANTDRKRDFTYPSSLEIDREEFPTSGGSAAFMDLLSEELLPFIKGTYRINDRSTLIGQSLGGLLATEILLKRPDMFDDYIIVSPSLWWDGGKLLASPRTKGTSEPNVVVAVGKEGDEMEEFAERLYRKLEPEGTDVPNVHFNELSAQGHGDALHLAVYDAFTRLYAPAPTKE